MKKKTWLIVVLVVVCVILLMGIVFFWLVNSGRIRVTAVQDGAEVSENSAVEVPLFYTESSDPIVQLVVSCGGQIVNIGISEGEYRVQGLTADQVDPAPIQQALDCLSFLMTVDLVENTLDNAGSYGIGEGGTMLRIVHASGQEDLLVIGDKYPLDELRYAANARYSAVFLISDEAAQKLEFTLEDVTRSSFFMGISDTEVRYPSAIQITRPEAETLAFTRTRFSPGTGYAYYKMDLPVSLDLPRETSEEVLLQNIAALRPSPLSGDGMTAHVCGLDEPDYSLELVWGAETRTVVFSRQDGTVYAMVQGDGTIYTLPAGQIDFLDVDAAELVQSPIYSQSAAYVSRMEISRGGSSWTLDIRGEGASLQAECMGKVIPHGDFMTFFNQLCGIRPAGILPADTDVPERPAFSARLYGANGQESVLAFTELPDRIDAVTINADTQLFTYHYNITDLIAVFENSILSHLS